MKYEELETEIKKLAEIVKGFPAEIRERSFDVLLGALIKEKGWERDVGLPPEVKTRGAGEFPTIGKISEATGIKTETLLEIFDPTGEEIEISIDKLNIDAASDRARAFAKLLFLYKKTGDRNFKEMDVEELRGFIDTQGEPKNSNLNRDLRKESGIFTFPTGASTIRIKPTGDKKIVAWLNKELGENA